MSSSQQSTSMNELYIWIQSEKLLLKAKWSDINASLKHLEYASREAYLAREALYNVGQQLNILEYWLKEIA